MTRKSTPLDLSTLEPREMPAVVSVWMSGSTWVARCNDASTSLVVESVGSNLRIRDTASGQSWSRAAAGVAAVELQGGWGNDQFANYVPTLSMRFFGGGGNDYLEGYNGSDYFQGDAGNDTVLGYGGDDIAFGNDGNDVLLGMGGNDQLVGGTGNDRLNGRDGADKVWGQDGDDVLICVDAGNGDYAEGGFGRDVTWADAGDSMYGTTGEDAVQWVGGFANGADKTLNGDSITDPQALSGHTVKRFANDLKTHNRPLFSVSGPSVNDIRQGAIGDCWLVAGLGAIALDNPHALRQRVVDFDDGTYGVRLGNSFYRVDADLAVSSSSSTTPAYAQFGAGNSMWVAVVEKAYAHYRTGANSFASIEGGWSVDVNRAFGSTVAGAKNINTYSSATALITDMYNRWNTYQAVTIGFLNVRNATAANGAPLVMSHMYTVIRFTYNSAGQLSGAVLRNPWGVDGRGNDGNNDGYVTVTASQLFAHNGAVNWGRV
jgi:hypothetical protein